MAIHYNLKNIRRLLTEGFTAAELRTFCYDHPAFRPVYEQLTESTGKAEIVHRLVEHAERQELFEPLLAWAREQNPAKYEKCQPYYSAYEQARPSPIDEDTLAAAEKRLARLPLDAIPDPATLPPGSRMPFCPNPLFVGREADFKTLAQALKGGQTPATQQVAATAPIAAIGQIAAATGLGGIGKTQLASEFVHRYGQYFSGGVFWLSFANPASIPAEITACGGAGGLELRPDFGSLPLEDQVRLVLSAWQSQLPRLLVFDNCDGNETVDAETLLAQWRPPTGGCRVLVTSRRTRWDTALGVQALALGVLSRAESVALLCKHRPDLAEDEADLDAIAAIEAIAEAAIEAIAEELGDLPLALHLAGSFLAAYRHAVTPKAYLAQLRDRALLDHPSLRGRGATFSPTGHESHVARTFALSYERLDPEDETGALALALLGRAACFAPGEPIPRKLLVKTVELAEDDPEQALEVEDALGRLAELGLLEVEAEGALTLHRLVAAFVEGVEPDAGARQAVEEALLAEANRLNQAGYPAPLLAWQPHLRAVTEAALARGDERGAGLGNTLGYHLKMVSDYAGARPYYERALAIREQVLGPEHPDTATSLNNLGGLLQAIGDYAGAQPYLERALAICEQVLGAEHPATAGSLNNLGLLLQAMGDYAGARPYYERALSINEQVLGPEHPDTATGLNNLGFLLQAMGDDAGARPYFERALAIFEQVLGPEHPNTATSLNNLGFLLQAMGDDAGARPYFERALSINEQVLGPEHPDTATSLNNLGFLLQAIGNYAKAWPCYERALAIFEQVLGPAHPDTALSLNNLGRLLQAVGDDAGARPYFERALAIREQVLGPEHPATARSLNNLGDLLQAMGDDAGARPYYERALAIFEARLGPDHPHTQAVRENLTKLDEERKK